MPYSTNETVSGLFHDSNRRNGWSHSRMKSLKVTTEMENVKPSSEMTARTPIAQFGEELPETPALKLLSKSPNSPGPIVTPSKH